MRATTRIAGAVIVLSLMTQGLGFAQPGWRTSAYDRCVDLASRQGLNPRSASGRKFVNRCVQRDTPRPSRNCPDDPKARSAYPAWMCP
jgi:hypothetical protein